MSPEQAIAASPMVAEGVRTSKSVHALSRKQGVEMPISEQVYRVLFEGANPREAIVALMTREAKTELG
jgi:glycerol-3-phosphate dehydrogenase (NAD(P)+)